MSVHIEYLLREAIGYVADSADQAEEAEAQLGGLLSGKFKDEEVGAELEEADLYPSIKELGDYLQTHGCPPSLGRTLARLVDDMARLLDAQQDAMRSEVIRLEDAHNAALSEEEQRPTLGGSWVIKMKATGSIVCEVFDYASVQNMNATIYEAIPILEHLQSLNPIAPVVRKRKRPGT